MGNAIVEWDTPDRVRVSYAGTVRKFCVFGRWLAEVDEHNHVELTGVGLDASRPLVPATADRLLDVVMREVRHG